MTSHQTLHRSDDISVFSGFLDMGREAPKLWTFQFGHLDLDLSTEEMGGLRRDTYWQGTEAGAGARGREGKGREVEGKGRSGIQAKGLHK